MDVSEACKGEVPFKVYHCACKRLALFHGSYDYTGDFSAVLAEKDQKLQILQLESIRLME